MTTVNIVFDLGQGGSIETVAMNLKQWMAETDVALVDYRDPNPPPADLTHYLVGLQHYTYGSPHQPLALVTKHHINIEPSKNNPQQKEQIATVTMSGEWYRLMRSQGAEPEFLRMIPHGIDLNFWTPQEREKSDHFTIGIVAHSYANGRKGEGIIPRIFELIRPLNVRLVIIGKGWAETVHALKSTGTNVEWREVVSRETLRSVYQDCSIYLCTSYVEGGPLPLLESMAMGATPVSTAVGLARDILPAAQLGYLFPKGNAILAARIITKLYYGQLKPIPLDKLRSSLLPYTWEQAAKQYEQFYREIIASKGETRGRYLQKPPYESKSGLSAIEWLSLTANPLPTDPSTQPVFWRCINRAGAFLEKILPQNVLNMVLGGKPKNQTQGTLQQDRSDSTSSKSAQISLPVDSHLSIIDDQGLVFIESTQRLFVLNTLATFIWCCFEDGLDTPASIKELESSFSISPEQAHSYIDTALEEWQRIGLLNPRENIIRPDPGIDLETLTGVGAMPPLPNLDWSNSIRYRLQDTDIEVFVENTDFWVQLHPVIEHLEKGTTQIRENEEDNKQGTIHVCALDGNIGIYRDRKPVAYFAEQSVLAPTVNSVMLQMAIDNSPSQFYFHAGVAAKNEQLLLLPGTTGAGKSTLTAGLVSAGFTYYSDEVALFSPKNPLIRPFPTALCSKSEAWPTIRTCFEDSSELPEYRRLDGQRVSYQPPQVDPFDPQYDKALPVKSLVFPQYDPNTITKLLPISRGHALQRLMAECITVKRQLTHSDVKALAEWICTIDCYELPCNSLDDSVQSILGLLE